ncbi:ricin-type beta-trefoil lectin domain protein [Streptomyces sp. N2-109]|uniref:Ricin-type beta-trefoil lectin domain protein n=1 Tax=Streptomyces gossypii TaxID=2883101 RepID=A0ABT2JT02_9ACTN|nr:ricin-type beta-trefoil lectin domain protein [Streptomyces gossypii]MCT2591005.1 ricin-type beta-trefoil lectin domain protein [Streptomyces gossypii]
MPQFPAPPSRRRGACPDRLGKTRHRSTRRVLAAALTALVAVPLGILSSAPPAAAEPGDTNAAQFKGVNWARPGDNFVDGPVVPEGLNVSDSYATVKAKATSIYAGFERTAGADTVRLPVNTHSVPGTPWGDAYAGAVDAATAKGFKVILSYWEDEASTGGRITDRDAFNSMWNSAVAKYGSNSQVYFEPMNEPHGYTAAEWADVAAAWIGDRPSVPKDRIIVSGSGYNGEVTSVCADDRLNGTHLSLHLYAFQFGPKTYDEWVSEFRKRIGSCGARTVLDEFGAPMDDGRNYNDAASSDNFVRYLRAATDTVRSLGMGAVYWPGLGGKHTNRPNHDWYSLYALEGSGNELTTRVRNTTAIDRLAFAWGAGSGSPTTALRSAGTQSCLDVPGGTHDNHTQLQAHACNGGENQQWTRTATGQITVYGGEKCLDALGQGTVNGTKVGIYDCNGGENQKWAFYSDGTIRGAQSGLCLDVSGDTSKVQLYSCWGGSNQQWHLA